MEESIVIQELLAKEKCILEKKEGIYYLNGKNIHSQIHEFLKILIHSTKKISTLLTQDELTFDDLIKQMGYREEKTSTNFRQTPLKQKPQLKLNTKLQNKYSQNIFNSLDDIYQSDSTKKQKYFGQILDVYQQLQLDILQDQFSIEFVSPFLLDNPTEQIYLPGQIRVNLSHYDDACEDCSSSSQEDFKNSSLVLKPFGVVLIVEQLEVQLDIRVSCECNETGFNQESVEINIIKSIKSEEYLKFRELYIKSQKFNLCVGYQREITVTQDENLKRVVIPRNILSYTNFIQDNNRYLSSLQINDNKEGLPTQNLQKELGKLRFSELYLSPTIVNKCITPQQLNSLDYLIYLTPYDWLNFFEIFRDKTKRQYIQSLVIIFNKKYSNTLRIFAFSKLFGDQFSLFRLMYDLYEFDYEFLIENVEKCN